MKYVIIPLMLSLVFLAGCIEAGFVREYGGSSWDAFDSGGYTEINFNYEIDRIISGSCNYPNPSLILQVNNVPEDARFDSKINRDASYAVSTTSTGKVIRVAGQSLRILTPESFGFKINDKMYIAHPHIFASNNFDSPQGTSCTIQYHIEFYQPVQDSDPDQTAGLPPEVTQPPVTEEPATTKGWLDTFVEVVTEIGNGIVSVFSSLIGR